MTQPDAPAARPILANHPGGYLIFSVAGAAALAGLFWFPLWFFTAQLLRLWAPAGGMVWLKRRGVAEYVDEQYATVIGLIPLVAIAARVLIGANWLEPFTTLLNKRKEGVAGGEMTLFLDVVLGIAIAAALSGVLRTHGPQRLVGLSGFAAVVALAAAIAFNPVPPLPTNGFAAIPLALLGGFTSALALFIEGAPARRTRRLAREAARIEDERIAAAARKERGY